MRRELIIAAAFLALLCSGTASAFALRTIMLEPAISTQIPEQLCWTSTWPDGAIINDPNGDFFLSDDAPGGSVLVPQTQAGSGCITLNPGNHELHIIDNDTASWTVKVS